MTATRDDGQAQYRQRSDRYRARFDSEWHIFSSQLPGNEFIVFVANFQGSAWTCPSPNPTSPLALCRLVITSLEPSYRPSLMIVPPTSEHSTPKCAANAEVCSSASRILPE